MIAANLQVVDVFMLVGNITPIALYFLILGLVNSHARPYLVTSRSDFIALSIALLPVLLWPLPVVAAARAWWALAAGLWTAGLLFFRFLPGPNAGFVIYNISEARCLRILEEALARIGLHGCWDGHSWRSSRDNVRIHIRKFSLLRNVSINVEAAPRDAGLLVTELGAELARGLRSVAQLPSTMGACLVVIGVGLLIVPMWAVGRHIRDIVDAMSHLFG